MTDTGYTALARVYDRLMVDSDPGGWAAYYVQLLEKAGMHPETALDLACGTGSIALELAARGIKVTGIDIAEDMLMEAQAKARKAGRKIPFVRMDMRDFSLHKPVDAIICANDGFNYLLSEEDVLSALRSAKMALKEGGALALDISSEYKLSCMAGEIFFEDEDDLTLLWDNTLNGRTLEMDLLLFMREADGRYARQDERHVQRLWKQKEMMDLLHSAGFMDIQGYGDREMRPPINTDKRLFFTAKKGNV